MVNSDIFTYVSHISAENHSNIKIYVRFGKETIWVVVVGYSDLSKLYLGRKSSKFKKIDRLWKEDVTLYKTRPSPTF